MATVPFSVRLDEDVKARLDKEAVFEKRSSSYLAQVAIDEFLDAKEYKRECIREALAEAEKGVFISEEAVTKWVEAWGTDHELPPPKPDVFLEKQKS